MIEMVSVDEIRPHPKNEYYFDDIQGDGWNDLLQSIRTSGVTNAITIDQRDMIISGHQRVRACKLLGIEEIPAHVIHYTDEELKKQKDVKDLIESNLKQRVPGNSNPVKLGRCFAFLEEYYGTKKGGNGSNQHKQIQNNFAIAKTQQDIADEVGVTTVTIQNYKRLALAIPEIQDLVNTGKVSPTTALSILRQLPEDEQRKLASSLIKSEDRASNAKVQELINRIAEKDRKIAELESREPEIKYPDDYRRIKNELKEEKRLTSAIRQDLQNERKKHDAKAKENLRLQDEIEELKRQTVREKNNDDLNGSALTFAMECRIFLQSMGGYTFVAEHLMELNEREREGYIVAAKAMRDWASVLIETIERNGKELYGSYHNE